MSKLTLEEAISHCLEVAEQNETQAEKIGRQFIGSAMDKRATDCQECAADYRQLAEWLKEFKNLREENKVLISECDRLIKEKGELLKKSERIGEYKRLLKAAVDGYHFIGYITKDYACPSATSCSACPMDEGKQCRIWEHADEALALIGEDGDTE